MKSLKFACIVLPALHFSVTFAYERPTHRELSKAAAGQSILSAVNNNVLLDFGLTGDIDINSSQEFPNSLGESLSIIELIQDGADFEDNDIRVLNHFYDPINDRPLQHFLLNLSGSTSKSPDWALEDIGDISGQEYSYRNAVNYFYQALTSPLRTDQDIFWGKMFQTLGHVIHHIQDMAQPEHTRNDLHCGEIIPCGIPGAVIGLFDRSLFEGYTEQVFKQNSGVPPYVTLNYPAVSFPTAREFWTTRSTDPVPARRGIADFTNRNFVSKDTNFELVNGSVSPNSKYSLPIPGSTTKADLATLLPENGEGASICQRLNQNGPIDLPPNSLCEVEFISTTVSDSYDPSQSGTNPRAASLSLFDQYLAEYNVNSVLVEDGDAIHTIDVDRLPTINRFNIEAAHTFLVPRAVAYSAGLINHFFRGKIDLVKDVVTPGYYVIKNLSGEDMSGVFELYYDGQDNLRYPVPNASWTLQIPAGAQSTPITFSAPTNPSPILPDQYILVFNGSMGAEIANGGLPGSVIGQKIALQYWEPWGNTLRENHNWDYFSDPFVAEPAPVNGILSFDTNIISERGSAYCDKYYGGGRCETPVIFVQNLLPSNVQLNTLRVRLRTDAFYTNLENGECSDGFMELLDSKDTSLSVAIFIRHAPSQNNVIFRDPLNNDPDREDWILYNNGTFAEYEIPIGARFRNMDSIEYWVEDLRSINFIQQYPYDCSSAYFKLDVDFIHLQ